MTPTKGRGNQSSSRSDCQRGNEGGKAGGKDDGHCLGIPDREVVKGGEGLEGESGVNGDDGERDHAEEGSHEEQVGRNTHMGGSDVDEPVREKRGDTQEENVAEQAVPLLVNLIPQVLYSGRIPVPPNKRRAHELGQQVAVEGTNRGTLQEVEKRRRRRREDIDETEV